MFILLRFFPKYLKKMCCFLNNIFYNLKLSSASRLFCTELRSEENKEKWDESLSRARVTKKKQGQCAPSPFPTRFSWTGGASVSDLCTLDGTLIVMKPRKQNLDVKGPRASKMVNIDVADISKTKP